MNRQKFFRGLRITILNLALAIGFAYLADYYGFEKETANMIFLIEVLLTTVVTGGYVFSSFTAIYAFLCINYFFTPPRYDFAIADRSDLVALGTFLITAIVVGVITSDLRQQRDRAEIGERAAQELMEARASEEQIRQEMGREELRATLLRSVAHDLRSPLTALVGTSRMLEDDYDRFADEERRQLISSVSEEALWLTNKVENILQKTAFDENKPIVVKQYEAIDDVVGEAVSRMERLMRGREFHVELPDEVVMAPMDGNLIVQVLMNVLANAVRHTPQDSAITLSVAQKRDAVEFSVADTGQGVDPAVADTLFDRFVTLGADASDRRRGIGLGLAICRVIVEAHGGTIAAESNRPHGAVFRFTLPLGETDSDNPIASEKNSCYDETNAESAAEDRAIGE